MIYNEYAQVLEATNPTTGELYKPEDLNVINWNDVRSAMLQDAIFAREAWLKQGTQPRRRRPLRPGVAQGLDLLPRQPRPTASSTRLEAGSPARRRPPGLDDERDQRADLAVAGRRRRARPDRAGTRRSRSPRAPGSSSATRPRAPTTHRSSPRPSTGIKATPRVPTSPRGPSRSPRRQLERHARSEQHDDGRSREGPAVRFPRSGPPSCGRLALCLGSAAGDGEPWPFGLVTSTIGAMHGSGRSSRTSTFASPPPSPVVAGNGSEARFSIAPVEVRQLTTATKLALGFMPATPRAIASGSFGSITRPFTLTSSDAIGRQVAFRRVDHPREACAVDAADRPGRAAQRLR